MGLLKSDLRISAGLLKEAAPDNHLLAYITPNERNMLVQAGGSGHITKSGIPSFEESWDMSVDFNGSDNTNQSDQNDNQPDYSNGGDLEEEAAQWYANLGSGNTSPGAFDLTTQYAKAKSAVSQRLKSTSSVGQIAVSNSAFFDFLKDNSLNKGIL